MALEVSCTIHPYYNCISNIPAALTTQEADVHVSTEAGVVLCEVGVVIVEVGVVICEVGVVICDVGVVIFDVGVVKFSGLPVGPVVVRVPFDSCFDGVLSPLPDSFFSTA